MCGILALVRSPQAEATTTAPLLRATQLVRHRGPDDEGYWLWQRATGGRVYAGGETVPASRQAHGLDELPATAHWQVGFGHRRLSIIDLSPGGHQPMRHAAHGLVITFNGEIYNYLEVRRELIQRGHEFGTQSDTEVILTAWAEWGPECLNHFNGMFAFALLDEKERVLHVVRDRFGVKPVYWGRVGECLAFASEIKQIRALPGFTPQIDESTAREYLLQGWLDHTRHTFDGNIQQLMPGERAVVRLDDAVPQPEIRRWYQLRPESWQGSDEEAAWQCRELLADSVRLRLRADVPVGSCLSGGLDSSAVVALIHRALNEAGNHAGQRTVTASYEDKRYDEWHYASLIIEQTQADAVRIWPDAQRLQTDLQKMLWHLDDPCGSTSQFNQWCVFHGAAEAGLKVMLDGQGSDEQLAGYEGSTVVAHLSGLLGRGELATLARELNALRDKRGAWPWKQLLLATRNRFPGTEILIPQRLRFHHAPQAWLKLDAPLRVPDTPARDLADSLQQQMLSPLAAHLRYEDRLSLAWSIESRLPFMDYRLVEFLAGLPDRLKLREGVTKIVLRNALQGLVPEPILQRRDKMGFVAPEKVWLREQASAWFTEGVEKALHLRPDFFHAQEVRALNRQMINGQARFSPELWRILCFGHWLEQVSTGVGVKGSRGEGVKG